MTKIKNFRITLRAREVARTLKNQYQVQVTPEIEQSIEQVILDSKRFLKPGAVYTTLTRATAEKATSIALPKKAVAVSIIAVNIGPELDAERQAAQDRNEELLSQIWDALRQEAVAQSIHFAMRLIQDQAKDEECETSEPWPVQEPPLLPSLEALLGVERIGIAILEDATPLPSSARMVWTSWSPNAKRSSKRNDPANRTEKVAA